jgi:hypothetical protein
MAWTSPCEAASTPPNSSPSPLSSTTPPTQASPSPSSSLPVPTSSQAPTSQVLVLARRHQPTGRVQLPAERPHLHASAALPLAASKQHSGHPHLRQRDSHSIRAVQLKVPAAHSGRSEGSNQRSGDVRCRLPHRNHLLQLPHLGHQQT